MAKSSTLEVQSRENAGSAVGTPGSRWWVNVRPTVYGYLFLAPYLVLYLAFLVYPLIQGFWISLNHWDLLGSDVSFAGLDNYRRLTQDPAFWSSLAHTLYFVLLSSPILIALGLGLAMLLNRPFRGIGLLRTLIYLPTVLSVSVASTIWLKIYDPQYGLIADIFKGLGLAPVKWVLQDLNLAMPAVILATIWWTVGANMLFFLAGLQDIPGEIYEAAKLDGANGWVLFLNVTLPGLRRTFTFVTVIQVIASLQVFGQIYIMTQGGPIGTTRVLVQYVIEKSFRDFEVGYGSAMGYVLFIIMIVLSSITFRSFTRTERESS